MTTQITLDENDIIRIVYHGFQGPEEVTYQLGKIRTLSVSLQSRNKPVCLLLDINDLGKTSAVARHDAVQGIKTIPFTKIALTGGSIYNRAVLKFVLAAIGQMEKMQIFTNESDAVKWLRE